MKSEVPFRKHQDCKFPLEVLADYSAIECFEAPGQRLTVGETTKRQADLYAKLDVPRLARSNKLGIMVIDQTGVACYTAMSDRKDGS